MRTEEGGTLWGGQVLDQAVLTGLTDQQVTVLERLINAFRADNRVLSCWLAGSFGSGGADAQSDLDRLVTEAFARSGGTRVDLIANEAQDFYRSFVHKEWSGFRLYPQADASADDE